MCVPVSVECITTLGLGQCQSPPHSAQNTTCSHLSAGNRASHEYNHDKYFFLPAVVPPHTRELTTMLTLFTSERRFIRLPGQMLPEVHWRCRLRSSCRILTKIFVWQVSSWFADFRDFDVVKRKLHTNPPNLRTSATIIATIIRKVCL